MLFSLEASKIDVRIEAAIIAGWTGRDASAVQHHIEELKALGVAPPSQVPLFYKVSNALLSQSSSIQVLGTATSGEVEPLLVKHQGDVFIGLASDHTDRELEAVSVAASKQVCAKPVSREVWRFADIEAHLDQLHLRCQIEEDGQWVTYQDGTLANIRPLVELIERAGLMDNQAMLCGTLGAIGGVRPASSYKMTLSDPVRDRSIALSYTARALPVVA